MEWLALLIPIATSVYLWKFHQHRVVWWELLLPIAAGAVLILGLKSLGEFAQTRDTEYWTGWVTQAEYYEDWNERVSCRHPKYRTETYTDSNGRTQTRQVFDGYEHLYDVDYHPEYWVINDNNGLASYVNRGTFEALCDRWDNRTFVDLHRNYHTNDGDKYVGNWDGRRETLEVHVTTHSYENRVQSSSSVFNYPEVSDLTVTELGLFAYPNIDGWRCPSILGPDCPGKQEAERELSLLNAELGRKKQVRMWILLYRDQPLDAGIEQEALWKGGNKNELVVCIGLNAQSQVSWSHVFSWTEVEELKIGARNFVSGMRGKPVDLGAIASWMGQNVDQSWQRKAFADFEYLDVQLPWWSYLLIYLVVILATAGLSYIAVTNEITESSGRERRRPRFRFRSRLG